MSVTDQSKNSYDFVWSFNKFRFFLWVLMFQMGFLSIVKR